MKKTTTASEIYKPSTETNTFDLIPGETHPWKKVLSKLHSVSQTFGYQRVETSSIEALDFYTSRKGLVDKLLGGQFVRLDLGSTKKFGLRPHNFLSVLRAYLAHQVYEKEKVTKWYYILPTFAQAKDRFSHIYEFGLVNFGEPTSISDAQMIAMLKLLLEELGIQHTLFEINSKGCANCAAYYQELLSGFLQQNKYELCPNCQQLAGKEVFKAEDPDIDLTEVFNCDLQQCQNILNNAPQIIDFLDEDCNRQLTLLLESLDELDMSYHLNPRLFGNSQLSHTIFRIQTLKQPDDETKGECLGIGGRYNTFVSKLTGQDFPTLVFRVPLETIFSMIAKNGSVKKTDQVADVFLINLGELAAKKSLRLFLDLLKNKVTVAEHFGENGIKNQFKLAEKNGCSIALVIGQKEALDGSVILRDVRSGIQEVFSQERIIDEVKRRLQE